MLEGLTEFIPVSSTGHVLLAGHFLGFDSPGRAFEVLIQLGAILAILGVYAGRLWRIFSTAPHDPRARRFILSVLVAFLPAVVVGVIAHDFIKTVLFETPALIAVMPHSSYALLIVCGFHRPPSQLKIAPFTPSSAAIHAFPPAAATWLNCSSLVVLVSPGNGVACQARPVQCRIGG